MAESVTLRFNTSGARAVSRQFDRIEQKMEGIRRAGERMSQVGRGLTLGVSVPLATAATAAVKLASDAQETENLFNSAMGSMTDEANDFVEQWSEATDLDPVATQKRLATFQLMISNMGVASDRALQMSEDLTKLTVDLASLRNVSFEQAFTKLQSGLSGEMEALRRWGIIVGQARIEQVALREGIIEAGEEMTQQQKIVARYLAIMNQTNTEQGDFIETQDQLANSFRTLTDQVKVAARDIGEDLIPVAQDMVQVAKDWVQTFADMDSETRRTIITVGALAAAFGPLLTAAGGLTQFLAFAPGAVSTLGTALGALASGPAAAALAVLVGAGGLIWAFNKISDQGNPAADAISEIAASMDVLGQTANERLADVRGVVRETRKLARLQAGRPLSGQIPGFQPGPGTQQGMENLLFGPRGLRSFGGGGGGGGRAAAPAPLTIDDLFGPIERLGMPSIPEMLGFPLTSGQLGLMEGASRRAGMVAGASVAPGGVRGLPTGPETGMSLEPIQGMRESMNELVNVSLQGSKGMERAAQTTISAFGAMAQAAVRGSDQMATSLINGITQIVQSIPGVGGIAGAAIGAAGGLLSAALGGGSDNRPQPVEVTNDSVPVEEQNPRRPMDVVIQAIDSADPAKLEHDLRRRIRRDATERIPQGTSLAGGS